MRSPSTLFRQASDMEVNKLAAARIRQRFLHQQIDDCLADGSPEALFWAIEDLQEIAYLIKHSTIDYTKPIYKNTVTSAHIASAEQFPIDQLIHFENGKAYAFCHEDSNPTLTFWKERNKARCFACNKTFNPIDVLVHRDKKTFLEAVRELA